MWIAFKNYYLRDTTQHTVDGRHSRYCCELLSKIIIFVTRHNHNPISMNTLKVVNCFQKLLSSWHDTTNCCHYLNHFLLWIAFKNYYLRDTTQLVYFFQKSWASCELLSKIIIFVTRHNLRFLFSMSPTVVNCFQKLLSSWHDTTQQNGLFRCRVLWIAFKNYYLRDTTQPIRKQHQRFDRCELLSKIIIFVTRHNFSRLCSMSKPVVNCFQKLLSSWHDTTIPRRTLKC